MDRGQAGRQTHRQTDGQVDGKQSCKHRQRVRLANRETKQGLRHHQV